MTERPSGWLAGRSAMTVLKAWHAALAGGFLVAYLTAGEDYFAMHQFAGYGVLAAIVARLALGLVAGERSPLCLPRPVEAVKRWRAGGGGRSPWFALFAAALLAAVGLVALLGALADFVPRFEDPHEAIAEASLWLIGGHVAFVVWMYWGRARLAALPSAIIPRKRSLP